MKVVIIEDEPQAARRLEGLLGELIPGTTVLAKMDTVKKAVEFFQQNPPPDLTLMDIQLADGISFEIFEKCDVRSPVIFTTAYDEYALKAFRVNSIDYILKPIDKDDLQRALSKFHSMNQEPDAHQKVVANLQEAVRMLTKKYKTRFVIKVGEHLKTVEIQNIQYFVSQEKAEKKPLKEEEDEAAIVYPAQFQ